MKKIRLQQLLCAMLVVLFAASVLRSQDDAGSVGGGGGISGDGPQQMLGGGSKFLDVVAEHHFSGNEQFGVMRSELSAGEMRGKPGYVVLVRHDFSEEDENCKFSIELWVRNEKGTVQHTACIKGKEIQVKYAVSVNKESHAIDTETIALNKKPYSLSKGRVFLVDLTREKVTIQQYALVVNRLRDVQELHRLINQAYSKVVHGGKNR